MPDFEVVMYDEPYNMGLFEDLLRRPPWVGSAFVVFPVHPCEWLRDAIEPIIEEEQDV